MPVMASTVPPDDERDRHEMTTEVLATYFVLAAIVLGVLLFIGVKKMAEFYFLSNVFDKSNDSEDREYNPHTPVPGLLYQLQMAYDKTHETGDVRPDSRAESLLQTSESHRSSMHRSNSHGNKASTASDVMRRDDNRTNMATEVTMPPDNLLETTPYHYENLPVDTDRKTHKTTSLTDIEIQSSSTSIANAEDRTEMSRVTACSTTGSTSDGVAARRYKKNTRPVSRPTSRGISSRVQ